MVKNPCSNWSNQPLSVGWVCCFGSLWILQITWIYALQVIWSFTKFQLNNPSRTVGVPSLLWCCWPLLRSNIAISGGLIPRSIEGIMGKTWHFTLWFIQLYGRQICSIAFEDGASIQLVCEDGVWKVDRGWFDNRYCEMICIFWQIQI